MRRAAFVVIVAASAACSSDPKLAVAVTHPTGLTVSKTTVTVYESDTLACKDIEYARVDAVTLEALAVTAADINDTANGDLSGISRTGKKVIVARGYDAAGSLISAGCTEKGEVVGDDTVAITTVIAAVVALQHPDTTNEVDVSLTDGNGKPLPDARPVLWTVYGPAGSTAATPTNITASSDGVWEPTLASCASAGTLKLHPNPPSVFGGYAVQIRVSWAVQEPPPYTSLAADAFGVVTVPSVTPNVSLARYCAIRIKGATHRLVCLATDSKAYDIALTVGSTGKVSGTSMGSQDVANAIAVVSVPVASSADRDVYAVSDKGVLTGLFSPNVAVTDSTPSFVGAAQSARDAIAVPPCGSIPAKIMIVGSSSLIINVIKQVNVDGSGARDVDSFGLLALDNAGCVTQLQDSGATLAQIVSFKKGATADSMLIACTSAGCAELPNLTLTRGTGVGFTGGSEPRIVASTVDATGVVLLELVFASSTTATTTVERNRMPAASLPDRIVSGQVDKDTAPDLFWDLVTRTTSVNFEIAYGRTVGTDHLEALSAAQALTIVDLAAGDLTGDGLDDVLVTTTAGMAVVPMGVSLSGQTANTDATCMP